MGKKSEVVKSVTMITLISVLTRSISFAFKIYLSRTVGAETLGLYQTALSVFMLFTAFTAGGLNTVVSRKISEVRAVDPSEKGSDIVTDALKIGLLSSVACVVAVYCLSPFLGYVVADARAVPLVKIMLPALVTTTLYVVLRGWFWGNKCFAVFGLTELAEEVLRILFTLLFVYGVFAGINGAEGLAFAFTASDFAVAIILVVIFVAKGGRLKKSKGAFDLLLHSAPITATRVFSAVAGTCISLILPLRLVKFGTDVTEATAAIGRISGMVNPLLFAPNALIGSLAIVLVPEMSANHACGNCEALTKNLKTGITAATAISLLFVALYLALGRTLTIFLYDDAISGEYLTYAAITMLPTAVNGILSSALNGIGMEKESFFSYVSGTVPMIAIVWLFTENLGIYSVIVGECVGCTISLIVNAIILNKRINIGFGYLKNIFKLSVCAVPCFFVAKWSCGAVGDRGFLTILVSGSVACVMYVCAVYVSGVIDIGGIASSVKENFAKRKNPLHAV